MKKVFSSFFILTFILMTGIVFADMGAPMSRAYKVKVSNENGADVLNYKFLDKTWEVIGHIDSGDEINVIFEDTIDGKKYVGAYFSFDGSGKYGSSGMSAYVSSDDVTKTNWELSDYHFKEEEELTILKKDGLEIHEWPADNYSVKGSIPYGTKIMGQEVQYGEADAWYYITYNGINGWICELNGAIGKRDTNKTFMTLWKDTPIRENTHDDSEIIGNIPANTVIDDYYVVDPWSWCIYVNYNGNTGYIHKLRVAYNYEDSDWYTSHKTYTVNYDNAVFIGLDNSITNIPKGTVVKCSYMQSENNDPSAWGLTSYNGEQGWLYCYGVFTDDGNGWMTQDALNQYMEDVVETVKGLKVDSGDEAEVSPLKSGDEINSGENIEPLSNENVETSNDSNTVMTSTQIILICVLCAVIASVTTAVIIIFVNKKK
ncbi:MAG: hypothetical protein IJ220_08850 [Clostridia bacterium]|nr:hypothetical protein [Clostridia bacterium]